MKIIVLFLLKKMIYLVNILLIGGHDYFQLNGLMKSVCPFHMSKLLFQIHND